MIYGHYKEEEHNNRRYGLILLPNNCLDNAMAVM